jgi:hypothetical protein
MPIPKLVVTAGLMIAQVALGMTKKIKGPRLEDLSVTLADYGTPIPRLWGKRRINPADHLGETASRGQAPPQDQGRQIHRLQVFRIMGGADLRP